MARFFLPYIKKIRSSNMNNAKKAIKTINSVFPNFTFILKIFQDFKFCPKQEKTKILKNPIGGIIKLIKDI